MSTASENACAPRWTFSQDATARTMWRDGVSAAEIGRAVRKSRNAVIGRAFRECWGAHPYGHDPRLTA